MWIVVVLLHAVLALLEVPALWGKRQCRGELWAVSVLLVMGCGLAIAAVEGYRPPPTWVMIEMIFKPISEALFEPKGG